MTTMVWTRLKMVIQLVLILGLTVNGPDAFARNVSEPDDDKKPANETGTLPARPIAVVTDPKQAIGRIAQHIKDNDARLRAVRVILQTKFTDRSVTKREEVNANLPNGGRAHYVRLPFSVRRERVLISGEKLLRESMDEDGEITAFEDGVWTQYVPKSKTAWLRLPEQMPGTSPLDPRNIASLDQRWRFIDRLQGDRVLDVGPSRTPDGQPRVTALMEHAFDSGGQERYRCEFDPARNDLPTRVVFLRDGNKIGIVLDITYQEVIPGTAWFLQKATTKFFGGELAVSPDSEAWRQMTIVETKGTAHVNEPLDPDAFVVKLPEGTRISDAVHLSSEKRSRKPPPR
jgi:hypothetical protein